MTESFAPSVPLAALDFSLLPEVLQLAIRFFLAVVAAVVAWFVMGPVARLLYRLAFQRPMPNTLAGWSQLVGAVIVGVLVFLFLPPFGGGGGGGGGLFGGGGGNGTAKKNGKGEGSDQTGKDARDGGTKKERPDVLEVEMAPDGLYEYGSGRYYLLYTPETPRSFASAQEYRKHLKTLAEVKDYLEANARRYKEMDILIYGNSAEPGSPIVLALTNLADQFRLPYLKRPQGKRKTL